MLERRRDRDLVPSYSLTGDLLSFLRCGLQYRYQSGSALPPSRPVQMWFGEFIHGVMETAYRLWLGGAPSFPWPCTPTQFNLPAPAGRLEHDIGTIGELVEASLAAAGTNPRSRDLRDSAYARANRAVNEVGPVLFPLIVSAEEKVIGTRQLSGAPGAPRRSQVYELHGVMDVLSSVTVSAAAGNPICDAVRAVVPTFPPKADIIVDYKGSRRPARSHAYWQQGDWQLQTYAWLRSQQAAAVPVVAGVLLYINELDPGTSDIAELQREVSRGDTDVIPDSGSQDSYLLSTWKRGAAVPAFSAAFRLRRMLRVVPVSQPTMAAATSQFDQVVLNIESCVSREAQQGAIISQWPMVGDEPTCGACDFRHFCPEPASYRSQQGYVPPAPKAP
ncbi:MAG TPA: PD-(D/E)XK nuclease family protein [Fimbriimonas sp.]|nr:PD-(D/E)XK nuclease family protein [Fimbriimonas sp.]